MKRQEVYLSSGVFPQQSLAALVAVCGELPYWNLELSSGMAWDEDVDMAVEMLRQRGRLLIHNYFPPPREPFVLNLAANDSTTLDASRAHCLRAIDLCANVGAPFYSVHAGFAFNARPFDLGRQLTDRPSFSLDDARNVFIESLQIICDYAQTKSMRIAVENNVVAKMNLVGGLNTLLLGATAEDLLEIHRTVDRPNLGFLVDVGHVNVTARSLGFDPHRFLEDVREHTDVIHLSDNDGETDSNGPFDASAWFMPWLSQFSDIPLVIEAYRLPTQEIARLLRLFGAL